MKARRYTEEQIIAVLKEGEAGTRVADLCRKYSMSEASYYNWKAKLRQKYPPVSMAKIIPRHSVLTI